MGISHEERVVGGKVRKYYSITDEGRAALAEARVKIAELTHEVVKGHGPAKLLEPSADDEEEGTD